MPASKRYKEAIKLVDGNKVYTIEEAIVLMKSLPLTKFDETVEISGKLGADPKQSDQLVRGSVTLPAGTGKDIKVLVFCEPEKEKEAKDAGADHIGNDEIVNKILKDGWTDFDCCIATPGQMRVVSKLGRFLGPRGLMPSPKTGTVTDNVVHAIKEAKRGKIDFRMDKQGCIHVGIGKMSFDNESLITNGKAFIEALIAAKPHSLKGDYIKSFFLSTTMSPSVKIAV
jgi:large subunit ribosomal protein L1